MDQLSSDEDCEPPARSKRGAVMVFLLGWLLVPFFAMLLGELQPPWFQLGCVGMLAFIAVLVAAMVRVVRTL